MPPIISLVGLPIQTPRLALFVFGFLMIWLANWIDRRRRGSGSVLSDQVSRMFFVGIVGSRIAYVTEHFGAYHHHLLNVLYVWQTGYSLQGGFLFALAHLAWVIWRRRLSLSEARRIGVIGVPLSVAYLALMMTIGQFTPPGQIRVGSHVPALSFVTVGGRHVNLAELRGQPAIINIWATWCPPCREEMPLLSRAYARDGHQRFALVGVDLAELAPTVGSFLEERPVTYPIWVDPAAPAGRQTKSPSTNLFALTGGFAVPTTIFVNRQGVVNSVYLGKLTLPILTINLQKIAG